MADTGAGPGSPGRAPDHGPAWGNDLSGTVHGPVVQARSIHGDVVFNLPPAAGMPVPRQLLAAPRHFTGRARELSALRGLLTGPQAPPVTLAVITGVGGVGKTSVALQWLHEVRDRYPDGQLYADLSGHQPDAAERPEDLLGSFLRSLGLPAEEVPVRLAEQAAAWRSLTDGRRLAILLDNAASAAQARVLLPGPGPSLVAVTTRWRIGGLAVDGGQFVDLGPLDEPDAVDLLDRVAGGGRAIGEPHAARAVVRLCGCLPLAVCVSGARLAARSSWLVGRIAAELASEQNRLSALHLTEDMSVRAAFDLSYQALDPQLRRAYRLLALVPGVDLSRDLAAAALGATAADAAGWLDALTEASLLEETGGSRYRFHDLVRLHARDQAAAAETAGEAEAAVARSLDWYLGAAVAADLVISPGRWRLGSRYQQARDQPPAFPSPADALEYLEAIQPGLLAAVRAAHAQGFNHQAWQLCEALWGLFLFRKDYQPWIDAHVTGLAAARACGDITAEARMLAQLGYAYLCLRQYPEAADHFRRSLELGRQEGHQLTEATALEHLALVDLAEGRHDQAIDAFARARAVFEQLGRARGAALMIRHIGEAKLAAGRPADAAQSLEEARAMFAALPDPYMEARTLLGLGRARLAAGQPEQAAGLLQDALTAATSLGARHEEARVRVALADAAARQGLSGAAREHLEAALAIYCETGGPEAGEVRERIAVLESGGPGS
jgi:tetratricopeptide (TPR) repeat protein